MAQKRLRRRTELHLARKGYHFFGVLFIVILFFNLTRTAAMQTIMLATVVFVVFDLLRQQVPFVNKFIITLFHPFMRESERHGIAGTSYLLFGTFIIMWLFNRDVVALSLLFLAVADPIASYVGIRYGKDKIIGNKSLQGTMAAFVASAMISATYYLAFNIMTDRLLVVSLLSGLIGAVSELIPLGKLDDNLTFPILSAGLLHGLFTLFGGY